MKTPISLCLAALLLHSVIGFAADSPANAIPKEFNDPDTGARMLHLSTIPNSASGVIYFNQPCITADGRYALVRYLDKAGGHTAGRMYRYEFKTGQLIALTDEKTANQVLAPKSEILYYTSDGGRAIYATDINKIKTRKVADMPEGILCAGGVTINADETLVAGSGTLAKEHENEAVATAPPNQGSTLGDTFARHYTNLLLTAEIQTGKVKEIHRINTWLGHTQFSPVDPKLMMFCHEGPWAKVDRIWTIRLEPGAEPQVVLKRTEENEIAGHEFWSPDGSTIWYDHNFRKTPGKQFLEGKNLATGKITRYPITAPFVSIHYVSSPDGKYFICDGGTNKQHPDLQAMFALVPKDGALHPVKLCSMARNDYKQAEPNPHLTPDQHWALFTATLYGTPQAYAVEMPKEFWR